MSVKSIVTLFALFLSISLIIGCGDVKEIVVAPDTPLEIIPLAVGNQWTYQVNYFNRDSLYRSHKETWPVDSVFYWGGDAWFCLVISSDEERKRYFKNSTLGLEELSFIMEYADLLYKYPVDSTARWEVGWLYLLMSVISQREEVEVMAGRFSDCVHYLQREAIILDWGAYDESWINPGVGRVKSIKYNDNPWSTDFIQSELVEYHLE